MFPLLPQLLVVSAAAGRKALPGTLNGTVVVKMPDGPLRVEQVLLPGTDRSWLRARGVQFGEHPVGSRRFQVPVPFQYPWKEVIDATAFGDNCINAPVVNRLELIQFDSMSESCLYLNVWAPQRKGTANRTGLPVLFWLYGGSFAWGGASPFQADTMLAVRSDAVVVTVNYRLGALGWLGKSESLDCGAHLSRPRSPKGVCDMQCVVCVACTAMQVCIVRDAYAVCGMRMRYAGVQCTGTEVGWAPRV
jgi:hypothetical protein